MAEEMDNMRNQVTTIISQQSSTIRRNVLSPEIEHIDIAAEKSATTM
jgi:hypothetical protein